MPLQELTDLQSYPPGTPDRRLTLRGMQSSVTVSKASEFFMKQSILKFRAVGFWAKGITYYS